ncbi:hypothetical protein Hanom_Chr08g00750041 [Helianthus anomalus]
MEKDVLDMSETSGITVHKKCPILVSTTSTASVAILVSIYTTKKCHLVTYKKCHQKSNKCH